MAVKFTAFDTGIRIAPGLSSDPVTGKVGQIYYNTTRDVLRICINIAPLTWHDLFLQPGTTEDASLRWDTANGAWQENLSLLFGDSTIYTPDNATQTDLYINGGDTTDIGVRGSDIYLQPGLGDAGLGYLWVDTPLIKPTEKTTGNGQSIAIEAGDTTDVAGFGGDLDLSAGSGPLGLGNLSFAGQTLTADIDANGIWNIGGETSFASSGDFFISAPKIGLNATAAVDMTGDSVGDLYYNTDYSRWRFYNGSDWYWLDANKYNIPTVSIDLYDPAVGVLPADTTTDFIDGTTVTDGILALMPTVDSRIQRATVVGTAITWTPQAFGVNPSGLPASGDTIRILDGNTFAEQSLVYNSTLSAWESATLPTGLNNDNILRFQDGLWVTEDLTRISATGSIYLRDESTADASKANNMQISASNKTDGTGDGGDLLLFSGTSVGGNAGDVVAQSYRFRFTPQNFGIPDPLVSSFVWNINAGTGESSPLFSDGVDWQRYDSADVNGEITGFENFTDSTVSFDNGTRTLTLGVATTARYYIKGQRVELTGDETIVVPDIDQANYITLNKLGALTSSTTFDFKAESSDKALVAIVFWNVNDAAASLVIDARTLVTIDWANRAYIRESDGVTTKGAKITLTGTVFDGTSNNDYLFDVSAGSLEYPDRSYALPASSVAASEIPVAWNDDDTLTVDAATALPVVFNVAPQWNELSGTWSQTSVTDGYYYTQWIVASRAQSNQLMSLMGQAEHQTLQGAIDANWADVVIANGDKEELIPVHKVIFRYSSAYANAAKSIVILVEDLLGRNDTNDIKSLSLAANEWRNTALSGGGTVLFTESTNTLSWSASAYLNIPGVAQNRNEISAGSVVLAGEGSVAYVLANRTEGAADTLSVQTGTFAGLAKLAGSAADIYVIAYNLDGKVFFGQREAVRQITLSDNTVDADAIVFTGSDLAVKIKYSLSRDGNTEAGEIHVTGSGVLAALSHNYSAIGDTGVTFDAVIDTGNLKVRYSTTSTTFDATMRFIVESWSL